MSAVALNWTWASQLTWIVPVRPNAGQLPVLGPIEKVAPARQAPLVFVVAAADPDEEDPGPDTDPGAGRCLELDVEAPERSVRRDVEVVQRDRRARAPAEPDPALDREAAVVAA